ncbi:MAG: type IV secretory system conjugative DNA transfer family protein [Pseudomonadota bacterium]
MIENETYRFGSAVFSDLQDIRRAGLLQASDLALFTGFCGKYPLWYNQAGGGLLVAGARGGKLSTILGYNLCAGMYSAGTMLVLDMKGEQACISQDQTPDQKFNIYWNPAGLHGLIQHRLNPVCYIRIDSKTLVSDVKVFCENIIPLSGSPQGAYFERRAREFLEAIILTLVRLKGILTLPDIYQAINLIPGGGDEWIDFAFEMSEAGFEISARIEEEIATSRENPTGGFQGILGEIFKAFAPLSDPILLESVSPYADGSFDCSLEDLCRSDQAYQMYLMPPAEFVEAWSPVIKAIFVGAMIYKARHPQAPQQTWILDECAQLGKFPLITKLYTYGAGIGIRPFAVYQSIHQMDATGPNAKSIISGNAALKIYFAVRDIESASTLSRMLGHQTLEFDDELQQARARHAKTQAVQSFISGGDPLAASITYAHHRKEAEHRTKQQRLLRTPDEILNMPHDKMIMFVDGLEHPIYADRTPYYEQNWMAGRFHPNPYHPPLDAVRVKTRFGYGWRRVVKEPVPQRFAHYPQYKDGIWSRVS